MVNHFQLQASSRINQGLRRGGDTHSLVWYAWKMENVDSSAILLTCFNIDCSSFILILNCLSVVMIKILCFSYHHKAASFMLYRVDKYLYCFWSCPKSYCISLFLSFLEFCAFWLLLPWTDTLLDSSKSAVEGQYRGWLGCFRTLSLWPSEGQASWSRDNPLIQSQYNCLDAWLDTIGEEQRRSLGTKKSLSVQ